MCIIERGVKYVDGIRQGSGIGGTCVNVGCVPKKLTWMAAAHREMMVGSASTAKGFGFTLNGTLDFDWASLKKVRDAEIKRLNGVYESGWKKKKVAVFKGFASFQNSKTVVVAHDDGKKTTLTSNHIVIAVGGAPRYPPNTPGAMEHGITSDGFFDLETQPKKAAVIGAGYIAVEMAGIFQALGTPTTLLCRGATVMRSFDPYIVETLMQEIKKHGPTLETNATVAKVQLAEDGTKTLTLKNGKVLTGFDCVLFAIGRTPSTKNLGLETCGVKLNKRGQIVVDEYENTNVNGIYAIGDVTQTGYELTPVAIAAGRRLADRLFGGCKKARIAYDRIPTVVFSHPPIGTVGLSEPDAKRHFGEDNITVRQARFNSMGYSFNPNKDHKVQTALKLVLHGPELKIVGLHIIGPLSDEMLQGFAVAVKMGATLADFENTNAIHPTIGEELVTFGGWGQRGGKPIMHSSFNDNTEKAPETTKETQQPTTVPQTNASASWVGCTIAFIAGATLTAVLLKKRSLL